MPRHARSNLPRRARLLIVGALWALAGCEQLGIQTPEAIAAAREADGKAIGAACRHAGRAIEDCYLQYKKVDRAAIFAGWREMNDYMRENKIDVVRPLMAGEPAEAPDADADADAEAAAPRKKAVATRH